MEFTAKREQLERAVATCLRATDKRTSIPILGNLLIEANGELRLTGTNLELAIRLNCPAEINQPGKITVPGRKFCEYLAAVNGETVSLKSTEKMWVTVSSGKSKARIPGMNSESFPELPTPGRNEFHIPAKTLRPMIARTTFAISSKEERFTLNGSLLRIRKDVLEIVATDGYRLAQVTAPFDGPAISILFPRQGQVELGRLCENHDGDVVLSTDENHIFAGVEKACLVARKLTGSFPDHDGIMPKSARQTVTVNRRALLGAIQVVRLFADERSEAIRLRSQGEELTISAAVSEAGEAEESVPALGVNSELELGLNARYVSDFLNAADGEEIELRLNTANDAVEFRPVGKDDYRYIVMPMRI